MEQDKTIFYFAYGSNHSPEMINAIIGRVPEGFDYILNGYEICIQVWEDIPKHAQEIIGGKWSSEFKSYTLRENLSKSANGKIWKLTPKEHDLIGNWELHKIWYQPIKLKKKINNVLTIIETELIKTGKMSPIADSLNYPYFIVDKNKILSIAREVREDYLKNK